jgi:hypothetical protein
MNISKKLWWLVGYDSGGIPISANSIIAYELSLSNKFVDVYFTNPVYRDAGATLPLVVSDLEIYGFVAGGATLITIGSIRQNNHYVSASASALVGGETVIRVFLTITGTPDASESFEIRTVNVYNEDGQAFPTNQTTGTIYLNVNPYNLWDAEMVSSVTVTGAGISTLADIMGNVNLTQTTDVDRPLYYRNRSVQFDRANTEFLVGGVNANYAKQQANDFSIVIKDLRPDIGADVGFIIAYFSGSNNNGWIVRSNGITSNSLQFLLFDNTTAKLVTFPYFEDQESNFIIQQESGVIKIYDENNNLLASASTSIGTITYTGISLFVGRRETSATNAFNGEWNKMLFYNQSLSSTQRERVLRNTGINNSYSPTT